MHTFCNCTFSNWLLMRLQYTYNSSLVCLQFNHLEVPAHHEKGTITISKKILTPQLECLKHHAQKISQPSQSEY